MTALRIVVGFFFGLGLIAFLSIRPRTVPRG